MRNGKLAIVTGASTGIGFELAHIAAQQGYDLVVVADEPLIDSAADDFRTHGTDVIAPRSRAMIACSMRRRAVRSTCCSPMPGAAWAMPSSTSRSPTGGG
jgi:NAD(P)-dependent dehydrogenase (short-subunit alcohol dehydrogenase family)